jgi:predicted metal-dependent phosphoesterase TrpH
MLVTRATPTHSAADLHLHTHYSDGRASPSELVRHVAAFGQLQVIAVTDHDTITGAREAAALAPGFGVTCIVGEEVSSTGGHIVGLFLQEVVPAGLSPAQTLAAIHAQGGLAFAPHPFFQPRRQGTRQDLPAMESVGQLVETLPFDAIEVINATPFLGGANRAAQRCNRELTKLPELACSDGHILEAVGKGFTIFPGESADDLRRAIRGGTTLPQAIPYTPAELLHYMNFWLRTSLARRGPAW